MNARVGAAQSADRELVITRIFDAPRSLVFGAWTTPEHLSHWSAPHGFTIPFCDGDLRPGGAWRCHMRAPDGVEHIATGVYREIVEPERLVFTHAWEDERGDLSHETLVTLMFEGDGGRTRLTLHQAVFETVTSRDGHFEGWTQSLERLADHVATRGRET